MGTLHDAIAAARAEVLARDRAALRRLEAAYRASLDRLRPLAALLQAEVTALGPDATRSQVLRLERWRQVERLLAEEVGRLGFLLRGEVAAGQADAVALGTEAAARMTAAAAPSLATSFNRVPFGAVEQLVAATRPGSPLARLLDSFGRGVGEALRAELTDAVVRGRHPQAVADLVTGQLRVARNRALTIVRTEVLRAHRGAALATYRANEGLVTGWRWVSAHQERTCLGCLALDGQVFPLSVQFMPSHPNCRCAAAPVVPGGEAPATGEGWLARQPPERQRELIPAGLWGEWQRGEVVLGDFVAVRRSPGWGSSYVEATAAEVRANAAARMRRAA